MKVEVDLPEGLYRAVYVLCEKFYLELNDFIVEAVQDYLEGAMASGLELFASRLIPEIQKILEEMPPDAGVQ